jgi:hypothetical protein
MRCFGFVLLAVLALSLAPARASNWKQLTGKKAQNNVQVNEYTASSQLEGGGWGPRWGSAIAAMDMSEEEERQYDKSKIIMLGGDDYDVETGLGGFHNDVYASEGEAWKVYAHPRDKNKNGDAKPRVVSNTTWMQVVMDAPVPSDITYRYWISCDAESFSESCSGAGLEEEEEKSWYERNCCKDSLKSSLDTRGAHFPAYYKGKARFSPRRNHAAVSLRRILYVIGGRAVSGEDMAEVETVGGILNPHFQDTPKRAREALKHSKYGGARGTRWREKTVLMNDVWISIDGGIGWRLANPGCLVPQGGARRSAGTKDYRREPPIDRTATGLPFEKMGAVGEQCNKTKDCYGDSLCVQDRCVCEGPSPRESHALTIDEQAGTIFLYGGFTDRRLHNCGVETVATGMQANPRDIRDYDAARADLNRISGDEFECGSGYRGHMSDVWKTEGVRTSGAKLVWRNVKRKARWAGRGGHVAFIMEGYHWIAAGRTGHSWKDESEVLNDVWHSKDGSAWEQRVDFSCTGEPPVYGQRDGRGSTSCPPGATKSWLAEWTARDNPAAVVIPKSVQVPLSTVYLFGGRDANGTHLNDVWQWHATAGEPWKPDFGPQAVTGSHFKYLSGDSKIEQLRLKAFGGLQGMRAKGVAVDYLTLESAVKVNRAGIHTIRELANADKDTVLSIRLHPDENERVDDFCDIKNLAKAVMDKCTTKPTTFDPVDHEIRGNLANRKKAGDQELSEFDQAKLDWDGCQQLGNTEPNPLTGEEVYADIDGVPQVQVLREAWYIEEWLTCKSLFEPRTHHKGVRFKGQVYLIGGRTETSYFNDMWVRDPSDVSAAPRLPASDNSSPVTRLTLRPTTGIAPHAVQPIERWHERHSG